MKEKMPYSVHNDSRAIEILAQEEFEIPVENLPDDSERGEPAQPDGAALTADAEPPQQGRMGAVRAQMQRGVHKTGQGFQRLRQASIPITSRFGDIAIGVAVVGAISITGLLWEPWRKRPNAEKAPASDKPESIHN